jgi:PKD repeat protein
VHFDGSGSSDSDSIDHVATYTFNFGEGNDDVVQTTPLISHQFTKAGLYDVKLVVTDSRGKLSANTAHALVQVNLPVQSIVSRKLHGQRAFDIDLPASGNPGIECRYGGTTGDFSIVYTFTTNITSVDSATLTGSGSVVSKVVGPNPNQVTVNLTGVANAQHLVLTMDGVHAGSSVFNNVVARMDVLAGDTNADGNVNSADIGLTKSQSGAAVGGQNFREDVTHDDGINSADISFVKSRSGTSLPPSNPNTTGDAGSTPTTPVQPAPASTGSGKTAMPMRQQPQGRSATVRSSGRF